MKMRIMRCCDEKAHCGRWYHSLVGMELEMQTPAVMHWRGKESTNHEHYQLSGQELYIPKNKVRHVFCDVGVKSKEQAAFEEEVKEAVIKGRIAQDSYLGLANAILTECDRRYVKKGE